MTARHSAVRIRGLEVLRVALPLRAPVSMSGERIEVARNVLVRVEGEDAAGWGEATSAAATTGETPEAIAAVLQGVRDILFRPGMTTAELRAAAAAALGLAPAAASALDIALADLEGRTEGIPLWRTLAPSGRPAAVPVSLLVSAFGPAAEVAAALRATASGVRMLKLKIGRAEPEVEAATARAIREAVGGAVLLGADANAGMTRDAALTFCRAAEPAGLAFVEQPLAREDIDGLAWLRRRTSIPVAADEGIGGPEDVVAHDEAGAVDGVMLKLQKAGSIERLVAAADEATRRGLRVGFTGKVAESSVAGAALLHAAAVAADASYGISLTAAYLEQDPVDRPITAREGVVEVPLGPGLGVAPVEERFRRSAW